MDLERLHTRFLRKTGAGSGRTYDALVEAAHQAGSAKTVCYCAATANDVPRLAHMFEQILKDMGYVYVRPSSTTFRVVTPKGTTHYKFTLAVPRNTRGAELVMRDHYRKAWDHFHRQGDSL